jgi:hypothetical protein
MESSRLPRFKRVFPVSPISLTERDSEIIRLIHRHRFLRSSQIFALLGGSIQPVLRRLQLLYHHGYLERPRSQLDYYYQGGSRQIVYGLGNKGGKLLKQKFGVSIGKISWGEKNRSVKKIFLEHALLVSDAMIAIELACRNSGKVRLLHSDELRLRAGQAFRWKTNLGNGKTLVIVPDRVFALEYVDPEGEAQQAVFFLEADRGTMPVVRKDLSQTSFYRKLLAYEATWQQGIHHSRFGFNRFRVLTITSSSERIRSLVDTCSQFKSGHGLFLFAERSVLRHPDLLFSHLFQTGRAGELASLLTR